MKNDTNNLLAVIGFIVLASCLSCCTKTFVDPVEGRSMERLDTTTSELPEGVLIEYRLLNGDPNRGYWNVQRPVYTQGFVVGVFVNDDRIQSWCPVDTTWLTYYVNIVEGSEAFVGDTLTVTLNREYAWSEILKPYN